MIFSTELKNFKGFKDEIKFPLKNINLLTGINGRGKSSFLQSLLLIRQSLENQEKFSKLFFNGSCVNLGTFYDVKNRNTTNDTSIKIKHSFETHNLNLELKSDLDDDMVGVVINDFSHEVLKKFQNIHYVAADRVGPQEFYLKSSLPEFINVGTKGEFVGNVLLQKRGELVNEIFTHPEENLSQELEIQSGKWLSEILDTKKIKTYVSSEESSRLITLTFGIGNNKFRATNVGFGYSYVLPIIVSGLIAKPGEILIVENPEAHLHPKAQSNLVKFLAKVASIGVQVFIESHSEHILNSLILASLEEEIKLSHNEISILYFMDGQNAFLELKIEKDGSISNWPDGFFDQQEIDLSQIFKLGRENAE
ncbi:hypothetical protein APR41_06835 [Salegentibacter salinarum]|uniref:DUF3696 domain-containing protein n=1 Tax=Salegentibacter salinarum TaxID=447422 RepID=A0A2N0TQX4_9FLAO|nr:DUF3696 domain-containing protein [Salegentibacter salinarum]PKD17143.1 hypothetical protein APR41_06835 [Salegentibacter salinarum]SKB55587.1 Predicted ATPase [Salegentibacter salinarum]